MLLGVVELGLVRLYFLLKLLTVGDQVMVVAHEDIALKMSDLGGFGVNVVLGNVLACLSLHVGIDEADIRDVRVVGG